MTITFDSPNPEPSAATGFSQNRLIRDAEHRDESSLPTALASDDLELHLFCDQGVIVRRDDHPSAVFGLTEAAQFEPDLDNAILLGQSESGPRVAVPAQTDKDALQPPYRHYDYRSLLYSSSTSEGDVGAIAQGASLLHWNSVNRFCGKCGAPTRSMIGGYRRECSACDHQSFPRTDPVVIMLAVKDDKCLMGRGPHFPAGWYSTLAGFVESGETIEDAVRRETFEESGIEIQRVQYYASQPWPFPHSLMIGVHCEAINDDIRIDDNELEDCRWFSRDEVKLMSRDEHSDGIKCPPSRAIASTLIQAWLND
jgi:NAD+ diphosphatase